MALVVDASVAVRWLLALDDADRADVALQSGARLIAPDLVIAEISNAIWKAVVFATVPAEMATDAVRESPRFFDELIPSIELKDRALQIAIDLRHPVYDCFYLALAEQRECQMITADGRLLSRCANTVFGSRIKPLFTAR
jgi:predicted nucleic acid-binding protein